MTPGPRVAILEAAKRTRSEQMKIQVSFQCDVCGAGLDWPDDATDMTLIVCKNCSANQGTYGDLRDKALADAAAEIEAILEGKRRV
jgi:hypothetical protein